MATVFTPPVAPLRPAAIHRDHPGYSLFRHYRPWNAGTNVWLLTTGVLTVTEPDDPALVARTYHGGHLHVVDTEEAARLTAAGYGANLSVVDDVVLGGLPGAGYDSNYPGLGLYTDVYFDSYGPGGLDGPDFDPVGGGTSAPSTGTYGSSEYGAGIYGGSY